MGYRVTFWILQARYMSMVLKKLKNLSIGIYGSTFYRENMTKCLEDIPEEMQKAKLEYLKSGDSNLLVDNLETRYYVWNNCM